MKTNFDKKFEKFYPKSSSLDEDLEWLYGQFVKVGVPPKMANVFKVYLRESVVKTSACFAFAREEEVLEEVLALSDCFGESPKFFKKNVLEMVERRKNERSEVFASEFGKAVGEGFFLEEKIRTKGR